MSEILYFKDCYLKEFDAVVTNVVEGTSVILDCTAFYPTSGGQPNDLGTIRTASGESYAVLDVTKKDGEIIQRVDKPGIVSGNHVHCAIDWDRRYLLMRYHTGAHILSTLIQNETGAEITGNQLYTDKARIDFSLEKFDRDLMQSFADKVNAIIAKNIPVTFRVLNRDTAFAIPALLKLRKQFSESIMQIRIVDIASNELDFDHQACGGTHVQNTSEIGPLEIYNLENKGRDRKRIYFKIRASI